MDDTLSTSKRVSFSLSPPSGSFDSISEARKVAAVKEEDEYEIPNPYESNSQPTATESASYVTPRDRLIQFLNSPQTPFEASEQASLSTSSRNPRFFDLHLDRDLQLRRIVVVDDLPKKVSNICDEWLSSHLLYSATANNFPFNKKKLEEIAEIESAQSQKNENTLASSYKTSFGIPLTTVASTLIFRRSKWESIFQFTPSPREQHKGKKFATPDGFLCVVHDKAQKSDTVLNSLEQDDKDAITLILKHNLHHIMLWEFKSLSAGSKDTLDKFVKLEGDFRWPMCSRRKKRACKDSRHDQDGILSVTGRKVGFDSRNVRVINEIYSLPAQGSSVDVLDQPDSSSSTAQKSSVDLLKQPDSSSSMAQGSSVDVLDQPAGHEEVSMEVDQEEASSDIDMSDDDESSDSDMDMGLVPDDEAMEAMLTSKEDSEAAPTSKASIPNDEAIEATSPSKAAPTLRQTGATDASQPSQATTKKRAMAKDDASRAKTTKGTSKPKKNVSKNPEHGSGRREHAYKPTSMAVQIWSECVKFDATIIVLNAGNYEIICIRCRANNTLYISPVLSVQDPIYKKTQISLHGLAFYDALDRAQQLEALEGAANPTFPHSYYLPIQYDPYPPIHKAAAGLSSANKRLPGYDDLLEDLGKYSEFDVLLPPFLSSKETKYDPCTMLRLPSESSPPLAAKTMKSAWTLELSERITERVYPVVARNKKASLSDKLVVKVAETRFEYNELLYEYEIHRRFEAESFGIKVFGILEVPGSQTRLLLMKHSGFSLDELRKKKKVLFARQHGGKYVDAIKALHARRFLHGNLKGAHFLISPEDGHVSLVSYKPTPLNRSSKDKGEGKASDKGKGKIVETDEDKEFVEGMKIEVNLAERLKKLI